MTIFADPFPIVGWRSISAPRPDQKMTILSHFDSKIDPESQFWDSDSNRLNFESIFGSQNEPKLTPIQIESILISIWVKTAAATPLPAAAGPDLRLHGANLGAVRRRYYHHRCRCRPRLPQIDSKLSQFLLLILSGNGTGEAGTGPRGTKSATSCRRFGSRTRPSNCHPRPGPDPKWVNFWPILGQNVHLVSRTRLRGEVHDHRSFVYQLFVPFWPKNEALQKVDLTPFLKLNSGPQSGLKFSDHFWKTQKWPFLDPFFEPKLPEPLGSELFLDPILGPKIDPFSPWPYTYRAKCVKTPKSATSCRFLGP